ncbi:hypothetical protein JCM3770_002265 [Rhodotorula araucariae]
MARRNSRAASPPAPALPEDEAEDESGSAAETSSDDEPVEANLATRAKRSNAGNRMAALIEDEAAAEVEDMFKEEEGDVEFEQNEEKDEFDSDFGSTDDDAGDGDDDEEAGERQLRREAKEAKNAARGKKKGFQAPVHPFARQTKAMRKAASAKQAGAVASTSATTLDEDGTPAKKRKKVAVDPAFLVPQRESSRRTAVESRRQVQDRLKVSEQRKATAAPKPVKKQQVTLTQADLIAEALEVEEQNRAALLAFYAAEEERREAERVAGMRYEIIGPKLTFLSRVQDRVDKGKGKEGETEEKGRRRLIEVVGETGQKGWKASGAETGAAASEDAAASATGRRRRSAATASSSLNAILNSVEAMPGSSTPPEPPREYARNWLVFDQFEGSRAEELEALFGDHADWSKRPQPARHLGICPFTGLSARYRDPLTLVPYANLSAFHQLRAMASPHAPFVWSDALGAYTGASGFGLVRDVELGWGRRQGVQPRRYAAAAAAPPVAAPPGAAVFFSTAPRPPPQTSHRAQPRPPAQQHAAAGGPGASADNPYKVAYAHAGGSGRGQRGRASLDAAATAQAQAPQARSIPGSVGAFGAGPSAGAGADAGAGASAGAGGGGMGVDGHGRAVFPPGGLPPLPPFAGA